MENSPLKNLFIQGIKDYIQILKGSNL